MKQILGNLCRASVAAAGVMVATSAASAESKPLQFETEFDLDLLPGNLSAHAAAAAIDVGLDAAAPSVSGWEQSIGAYLDTLLNAEPKSAPAPATQVDESDADAAAVIEAEIDAFTATELAAPTAQAPETKPLPPELLEVLGIEPPAEGEEPADVLVAVPASAESRPDPKPEAKVEPANPLLLAPVLSHPMNCEMCHAHLDAAPAVEQAAAPAQVDDAEAWQTLADWAAARAAADTTDDNSNDATDTAEAVTAESDFFFDFFAGEESPTE